MPDPAGQVFGKYVLIERIAAGGMAEIFRAKYMAAAGVTKPVVIKRILPHYAGNDAFVSMFINEAKIAVGLSHGNIAQVFDFGEIEGEYFLAMELVDGPALSRILRRATELGIGIPAPIAVYIASKLCNGLHYAHTRADERGQPLGIVHRDVSPQNVLVTYEGEVKIVDFGIAKVRSAGEKTTEHGHVKGKYIYFSPEQARGRQLDGRSDIFATGIVLYEMLTGRRPFEGKVIDVLGNIVKGEFMRPTVLNPAITPELEAIVLRAMAVKPENRYPTALDMHDELQHYLHTVEPRFSAGSVTHFIRYLFREELTRDGVRVDIPAEFNGQLERWRALPNAAPAADEAVTRLEDVTRAENVTRAAEAPRPPTIETEAVPGERTGLLGGKRGLVIGVGAALVFGVAGAAGVVMLATPDDPVGRAEVTSPDAPVKAPPAVAETGDDSDGHEAPEARVPAPVATVGEGEGVLRLDARDHALPVPSSGAARLRLEPSHSYRLTVEGVGAVGAGREVWSVFFFGERVRGAPVDGSYGELVPGKPRTLSGVRALYAFVLDDSPRDNTGPLRVRVHDLKEDRSVVLTVDPARHVLPGTRRLARLEGLDLSASYELAFEGNADLGAGGGLAKALMYLVVGEDGGREQGLLEQGASQVVRAGREVWLLLPDDDPFDNRGELRVRISPQRNAGN